MSQNIDYFDKKYDEKRDDTVIKTGSGTTDKDGMFSLPKSKEREYRSSIFYFPKQKKYFVLEDDYDNFRNEKEEKEIKKEPLLKKLHHLYR